MCRIICVILAIVTILMTIFGFVLFSSSPSIEIYENGCAININNDLTYEHPLILKLSSNEFILPPVSGPLKFNAGEKLRLACPGNRISVTGLPEAEIECVSGTSFKVKGASSPNSFKDLKCADYPQPSARKTGNKCSRNYAEIEIGFTVSTGFIRLFTSCLDEVKRDTLYTTFNLVPSIGNQQIRVPRPDGFEEGGFYPGLYPTPSALYSKGSQLSAFGKLLKSDELAKQYVKLNDDYFFLSRGHMTAKADFVYGSQQRATFYYVNTAPQWQIFNEQNWNTLEQDVRYFARQRKTDLQVITGAWGISTLPDINKVQTPLYLFVDRNGKHQLSVPEVYWKVLYDPETKDGIAFVGHNNPYETDVAKKTICKNVCDKIKWLNWHANNITEGFSYCCDVNDLKKVVSYMPDLTVQGLLV